MSRTRALLIFAILISIIFAATYFAGVYLEKQEKNRPLSISFLNVGQGDGALIQSPNGTQFLIDCGPNQRVLLELRKEMPFFDRSIDAIIVTNSDQDHFGGCIDVLKQYKVGSVIESGVRKDSESYKQFRALVVKEGSTRIIAKRGMDFALDEEKNVRLEILFPDRDVEYWTPNNGSIVAKLKHDAVSVLLMGDSPMSTEEYLLSLDSKALDSDIVKVGHHGSHTSTSDALIKAATPLYAIISDGQNNRYGHPHKETLETLTTNSVPVLRTDQEGTIRFISDGVSLSRK